MPTYVSNFFCDYVMRLFFPRVFLWVCVFSLFGFVLLVFSAVLPAIRGRNEKFEHQSLALNRSISSTEMAAGKNVTEKLPGQLPSFSGLSLVIDDLQSLASRNGVILLDARFKPEVETAGGKIGCVEIVAHLKGGYPALKKTAAGLLAAHGGLGLRSLSVRRDRSMDLLVDANLRFAFFFRENA